MTAIYPVLISKIAERGIKKSVMANTLGITERTLYNKLQGKAMFGLPEAQKIQHQFFPDIELETLFTKSERAS